jgi:hypothetical protein
MRGARALVLLAALVAAAGASAAGGSTAPQHPNPLLTNLSLDYVSPIPAPGGGVATLEPLEPAAITASVRDLAYLRDERGDWGGFAPAPLRWLSLQTGAVLTLGGKQKLGVPLYENEAGGRVQSFTYPHGVGRTKPPPPPPAVTQPPLPAPPRPPCANSGFGGCAINHQHSKGTKPTGPSGPSSGGGGSSGGCGTTGLSIVSDLHRCRIVVVHEAPGDSAREELTITNTSSSSYTLSFEATGTPNTLWNDLELGVWRQGTTPPTPLPPLGFWTTQYTPLLTLDPGQRVRFTIELYLPATAGNADQRQSAVIDFHWRALAAD